MKRHTINAALLGIAVVALLSACSSSSGDSARAPRDVTVVTPPAGTPSTTTVIPP